MHFDIESATHKEIVTNINFCQEAIALVGLLVQEPKIANQETLVLFALMHFHISRFDAKTDNRGESIPIDLQDRTLWKREYFNTGVYFLSLSNKAQVGSSGRFFLEASIAKEHCQAKAFEETNWKTITECYEKLIEITHSPVTSLNHAIALGYSGKLKDAIKQVERLCELESLANTHMPMATLAHLNAKIGNGELAYQLAEKAKEKGGTQHEHRLMMTQIERLLSSK